MAINTTVRRAVQSPHQNGNVNISFTSTTGFTAGSKLGIGGDLAIQLINELPMSQWHCKVTAVSRASHRSTIHAGDAVQDQTIPSE